MGVANKIAVSRILPHFGWQTPAISFSKVGSTESLDLSKQETKLPSYWTLPFTELCLGMSDDSATQWISVPVSEASLLELIKHGGFQATTLFNSCMAVTSSAFHPPNRPNMQCEALQ